MLVPLVVSTTAHQRDNAEWLAGQGAGDAPAAGRADAASALAELLSGLTREALLAMATKARALAQAAMRRRVSPIEIERLVAA